MVNITQRLITNTSNFTQGRAGHSVGLIVLHTEGAKRIDNTADRSLYTWFQTNTRRVSAHYYVTFGGVVEQYVLDEDTAYQAGDFLQNRRSIGIEHQDNGYYGGTSALPAAYTDAEYEASAQLVAHLCRKFAVPAVFTSSPRTETGITIHKLVGQTGCPQGLDYMRIVSRAAELMQPGVRALAGVTLTTPNPQALVAFYREVLGLAFTKVEAGVFRALLPEQITLTIRRGDDDADKARLTLRVGDLNALSAGLAAAVVAAGVTDSGRFVTITDPAGNVLDLVE